ncbi:MAG: DUF5665 domain-containing protein [Candidatus Paceibacterota bacterium]
MEDEKLITSIQALKKTIDRTNSIKWAILLGAARGVGAVIGATVLAGLLLGLAATTFEQASDIPYLGSFFSDIQQSLDTQSE